MVVTYMTKTIHHDGLTLRSQSQRRYVAFRVHDDNARPVKRSDNLATATKEAAAFARYGRVVLVDTVSDFMPVISDSAGRVIDRPQEFPGTHEERQANLDTHAWFEEAPGEGIRCGACDCRMLGTSSYWPCGTRVPRETITIKS